MEGRGSYQDYDEFEMLLGEINVTSVNPHAEDSITVNSSPNPKRLPLEEENGKSSSPITFTNYYRASQASSPDKSPTFYGGLSFERPKAVSVNSFQTSFDQKLQMNGNLEGGKIIMKNNHPSPIKDVCSEGSNHSEGQSLASAFTQLSFEDGVVIEPRSPSQVNSNISQNCTYLSSEGQYPNCLKKSLTRLNSGNKIISSPASPNTLNGMPLLSPTKRNLDNFNVEANDQASLELGVQELKKNHVSCLPLENLSGDLEEQQHNLPAYSRVVPIAPSSHSFQVLSSAPVHGLEYSVTPYQQQHFLDAQSPSPYMQPQDINQSHVPWPYIEDERYYRMHQHCLYLQQFQDQGSGAQNMIQENINATIRPTTRNVRQPYYEIPFSHQLEQTNKVQLFDNTGTRWRFNPSEITVLGDGHRYYAQEFSGREASCPFSHDQKQTSMNTSDHSSVTLSAKDFEAVQVFDKVGKHTFPEKILTRSHGLNSLRAINPGSLGEHTLSPNHATTNGRLRGNGHVHQHASILNAGSFQLRGVDGPDLRHGNSRLLPQKYNSVDEVVGRIYLMAKDQHGCRFLQRKLTEGNVEDVNKIFFEIIDHIVELVIDPFGNYLVQKLLEVCNESQRTQMLHAITRTPGDLVRISSDMHGTRAVQKVIETLKTPEQFSIVVSSLKPGILTLIKDMNGNHVAQRCFQYLIPRYSEFLFQAVIANFIELATDRHGCCVLQKCLSHSDGEQRRHLIYEITSNALILSQDPFGNYVVQYVFDLRIQWAIAKVLDQLDGNYGYLSMQKYSSNVVEKCLRYAGEERRSRIIQELISHSRLDQISQHPFGNYVVQAALNHSKGAFHAALVETLEPHVAALRTSPFGKKVLSCISLKK